MSAKQQISLSLIAILVLCTSTAVAQKRQGIHPLLTDTFTGSLGWFSTSNDTKIEVGSNTSDNSGIDFENDLGFDDNTNVGLANFQWRFTENFRLSLEYTGIHRNAKETLLIDIEWEDLTFHPGSKVSTDLDTDVYRVFVGYSFLNAKNYELGVGLGLHLMDLSMQIKGNASTNNGSISYQTDSVSVLAPLPNVGIYGAYAFSPKIIITGRFDWLSANTGDYSGSITSLSADIQYQAFKNLGIGIGYHYFGIDIDVSASDWKGSADYSYHGPKLFMTFNF